MTYPKPRTKVHDYRVHPDHPDRVVMREQSGNWYGIGDTQTYTSEEVAHWTRLMPVPEYRPAFRARRYDTNPVFAVTSDGMFLCSNHDRGLKPGWACPNCRDLNGNPLTDLVPNCRLGHDTEQISCEDAQRVRNVSDTRIPTNPSNERVLDAQRRSEAAAKTPQGATNRHTNAMVMRAFEGKSLLCQMAAHHGCITAASECNCECHASNET